MSIPGGGVHIPERGVARIFALSGFCNEADR